MRRGDIVTVALSGDHGKPRPAVVIQTDVLADMDTVLVCLITSTHRESPDYRLTIEGTEDTGLRTTSHVMVDKIFAAKRDKCRSVIGHVPEGRMAALNRMLAVVIGLVD